jgi:hypothetical protein
LKALNRIPRPSKGKGAGHINERGHRVLVIWDGDERRIITEHRYVMEQAIGRRLNREEVVHHINLAKLDNRISNLWLCVDQAEHLRIHAFTERLRENGILPADFTSWHPSLASEDKVGGSEPEITEFDDVAVKPGA